MKITCLASGSSGNCYLLETETECLILDCGIPIKKIKKALNYDISRVVGVCATHGHLDHSLSVSEFERMGIPVFKPYENYRQIKYFGKFIVKPFECKHNVPCYGFYVRHPDIGSLIYVVDTCYIKYHFQSIQHIMVECNWNRKYVDTEAVKYRHELCDHMEQSVCMDLLKANNSDSLKTVILCHTSDSALDVEEAVEEAKKTVNTGVTVDYASSGKQWELTNGDKCPFM